MINLLMKLLANTVYGKDGFLCESTYDTRLFTDFIAQCTEKKTLNERSGHARLHLGSITSRCSGKNEDRT